MIEAGDVLAIHPGALGDVLLAIPALRALRGQHPGRALVLAAQPRIGQLLASVGEIDRTVDFEALGLGALFASGPGGGLPALARAGRVVCWFGSRDSRFVANLHAIAPAAVVASPAGDGDVAVWCHLRRTVMGSAGDTGAAPAGGERARVAVPDGARVAGHRALRDAGWDGVEPLLVLHPGAGSAAKRWSVAGFAAVTRELCSARRMAVAVHQGPADGAAAAALAAALGPRVALLREPPLATLAGALALATLYVGNDSGVSHLAAAVGAPSAVLYTRALLAWRPWGPRARWLVVSTGEAVPAEVAEVIALAAAAMAVDSTG